MKDQKVNLGGDRLGSGSMMDVTLSAAGKSSHNLSRIWRSSATNGTLIPFLTEVILPGDRMKCHLEAKILTHPTTGPLFGYFKTQMDLFKVPMRYYMAPLHNNYVDIGEQMDQIMMPQMRLTYQKPDTETNSGDDDMTFAHLEQVAPDSLMAYLGIRAIGRPPMTGGDSITRDFNAIPMLAMADIYKMYYANLQEGVGAIMSTGINEVQVANILSAKQLTAQLTHKYDFNISFWDYPMVSSRSRVYGGEVTRVTFDKAIQGVITDFFVGTTFGSPTATVRYIPMSDSTLWQEVGIDWIKISGDAVEIGWSSPGTHDFYANPTYIATELNRNAFTFNLTTGVGAGETKFSTFDLKTIDKMRMALLKGDVGQTMLVNQIAGVGTVAPYADMWGTYDRPDNVTTGGIYENSMNGLFIKTLLSDRFQTWLETDLVDTVTAASAIDVSDGLLTMDSLNLAKRTYELLNRVVAAGNTYASWLKAVWNVSKLTQVEMPIYIGGASGELGFQEVVSTAETESSQNPNAKAPLGSLAGRGVGNEIKGKSTIIIEEDEEPCLLIGLVSLTPRVDYSQGNKWWTGLKSQNELHKPQYDGIGFQDLITDEIMATDTQIAITTDGTPGAMTKRSAGKQPAFIEYQTAVNECYGSFAKPTEEMFMTLAKVYTGSYGSGITNLTSYINPADYLQAFATSDRTAQHFWIQIGITLEADRLMSATSIPNL